MTGQEFRPRRLQQQPHLATPIDSALLMDHRAGTIVATAGILKHGKIDVVGNKMDRTIDKSKIHSYPMSRAKSRLTIFPGRLRRWSRHGLKTIRDGQTIPPTYDVPIPTRRIPFIVTPTRNKIVVRVK